MEHCIQFAHVESDVKIDDHSPTDFTEANSDNHNDSVMNSGHSQETNFDGTSNLSYVRDDEEQSMGELVAKNDVAGKDNILYTPGLHIDLDDLAHGANLRQGRQEAAKNRPRR